MVSSLGGRGRPLTPHLRFLLETEENQVNKTYFFLKVSTHFYSPNPSLPLSLPMSLPLCLPPSLSPYFPYLHSSHFPPSLFPSFPVPLFSFKMKKNILVSDWRLTPPPVYRRSLFLNFFYAFPHSSFSPPIPDYCHFRSYKR